MAGIRVDVWLYGALTSCSGQAGKGSFANRQVHLPEDSTIADLLAQLELRTEERGITFINGRLSAMPGLQPDLGHILSDGDRVGFFDLRSMWPFQYRHGGAVTEEMEHAMVSRTDHGLHHTYNKK